MDDHSPFSWDLFHKAPIVGIIRGMPLADIQPVAQTLLEAELFTLEVTMNTPGAPATIAALRKVFPNLNVGAGTVCTLTDLEQALTAGAQFIVTPILNEAVVTRAVATNIPIFPGAFTPTEIYRAWSLGASAVKVFPATQLGAGYIKDVLAPLNDLKLLPTGGVSKDNIKSFFDAGAVGVGMGSSLFDKQLIARKDFAGLHAHFKKIQQEIQDY